MTGSDELPDGLADRFPDSPTDAPSQGTSAFIPAALDATLALLRHGETTFIVEGRFQGQANTELTPLGRRQAELAGRRIADRAAPPPLPVPMAPPLWIVHSPLDRTTEVARHVAEALAAEAPPMRAEPGIAEIGQGAWEGLLASEIATNDGQALAAWRREPARFHAPGGESLADVQARVRSALARLLRELAAGGEPGTVERSGVLGYRGGQPSEVPWAILVGHDGVFKVLLLTLLDLPLERFWSFPFALAGISVVEIRGGRASLRAHNLADHLSALAAERVLEETEERQKSGAL